MYLTLPNIQGVGAQRASELRCSYVTLLLWVNCFKVNSEYSLGHFWNRKHGEWCCFTSLEFLNSGGFEWGRSHSAAPAAECATVSCLHLASETDWEEGRFEKLHRRNIRDIAVGGPRKIERRGSSLQSESSVKKKNQKPEALFCKQVISTAEAAGRGAGPALRLPTLHFLLIKLTLLTVTVFST